MAGAEKCYLQILILALGIWTAMNVDYSRFTLQQSNEKMIYSERK